MTESQSSSTMDSLLCDELLIEIFTRIPTSKSPKLSLVSKRWLHLHRISTTSLSLSLHRFPSLSSLLLRFPFLSSLSVTSPPQRVPFDEALIAVSRSCNPNLRALRFLAGPVTSGSLISMSKSMTLLVSLTVCVSRPLNFIWVRDLLCLKELNLVISGDGVDGVREIGEIEGFSEVGFEGIEMGLRIESLSVSGIAWGDVGMGWLWRNCKKLRMLKLKSCEGFGDGEGLDSSFSECVKGLREVELRTCRMIVDNVLEILAENCDHLDSLLVYDGGSKDGFIRFITRCRSNVMRLDLRLPLDLDNDHLMAMASGLRTMSSLRLQSCCLVTGEGLKGYSIAVSNQLEELALTNCDVVERVPGLLATLGQNLRRLRSLDLSYNELLVDKELVSMLVSCGYLVVLKLRGCRALTRSVVASMIKCCKYLEHVDIVHCRGIDDQAVKMLLKNLPQLRRLEVDECKIMESVRSWASHRCIEIVA
ncbi:hypothetical protein Drorol1_Dr00013943 [Drosera rotundifolia]